MQVSVILGGVLLLIVDSRLIVHICIVSLAFNVLPSAAVVDIQGI